METSQLIQDTLSDSNSILERVKLELRAAKSEILVAMAWFTDQDLFELLKEKIQSNVTVKIILSDQPENEKLDFNYLESLGAEISKIKSVGWGMMNDKFCIIDRKLAINGSFNWTRNAMNNQGSVIVTNFPKTVNELIKAFEKIKYRIKRIAEGATKEEIAIEERVSEKNHENTTEENIVFKQVSFQENSLQEFKSVLDSIIATEVGNFDREFLKTSAYERAKDNNGDHQVLSQAMDSLYSNFINEIEVVDEKKQRLKGKIEEQLKVSIGNVELKTDNEINMLHENAEIDAINFDSAIFKSKQEISEKKNLMESNFTTKIPFLEKEIDQIQGRIDDLMVEFVKPPVNWPLTILSIMMTILLAMYIFVFYSSVAYILIFSSEDIKEQIALGQMSFKGFEVFDPHAMTNIMNKGFGGILFQFLFVALPLTLGMFKVFFIPIHQEQFDRENIEDKRNLKFFRTYGGLILILIIDVFIAYKVAVNINSIELLTRETSEELNLFQIFITSNFWMVFVLGALSVYLFSIAFNKLFDIFNLRNSSLHHEKTKHKVNILKRDIENKLKDIQFIKIQNDLLQSEISTLESNLIQFTFKKEQAPIKLNERINILRQQVITFKEKIENLAQVYKSQIENDKLPISKAEMENRINIFMEGWSKYLNDFYAVQLAQKKTTEAIHECENWLKQLNFQPVFK